MRSSGKLISAMTILAIALGCNKTFFNADNSKSPDGRRGADSQEGGQTSDDLLRDTDTDSDRGRLDDDGDSDSRDGDGLDGDGRDGDGLDGDGRDGSRSDGGDDDEGNGKFGGDWFGDKNGEFGDTDEFDDLDDDELEDMLEDRGIETDEGVEIARAMCERRSLVRTRDDKLRFPERRRDCDWGNKGNLDFDKNFSKRWDQYAAARSNTKIEFTMPRDAFLCSIDARGQTERFWYDDHIMILLEEYIVISRLYSKYILLDRGMKQYNGLVIYDWDRLVGTTHLDYRGKTGNIYPTRNAKFPGSEKTGAAVMEIPEDWFRRLPKRVHAQSKFTFKLVTIGDNNPGTDCHHMPLNLDVKVKYVRLP